MSLGLPWQISAVYKVVTFCREDIETISIPLEPVPFNGTQGQALVLNFEV